MAIFLPPGRRQGDMKAQAEASRLPSECGPCPFLKEYLPKKIPQNHTLV